MFDFIFLTDLINCFKDSLGIPYKEYISDVLSSIC